MPRRAATSILLTALLVAGCEADSPAGAPPPPATTAATSDLDHLLDQLETIHPEPFHGVPRATWVTEMSDLQQQLPELTDDQLVVEVMRLVALLSREGRDGHQFALPQPGHEGMALPLRWYELEGDLVVTEAMAPYADLAGSVVEAVDGTPVTEVLALAEPLVPRDGPATVSMFRPMLLLRMHVLRGLGIAAPDDDSVTLTVSDGGQSRDVDVAVVPHEDLVAWAGRFGEFRLPERPDVAYRHRLEDVQWSRWHDDALHVRLTEIQEQPSAATLRRLEAPDLDRVVLDLRQNPGGNNGNNHPWVTALTDVVEGGVPLVVLTDRVTFSAASNLATDLDQAVDPVFVGEPMGGGLNFWNDVVQVRLDDLAVPMQVGVSTIYWQRSSDDDPRLTIRPDLPVPVTAADVFGGRDPALRVALGPLPDRLG